MVMKRTTVFADEADLAVIKQAALRQGVSEAELIRDAIHLAAMSAQSWSEPFFSRTFSPEKRSGANQVEVLNEVWDDKAGRYERTKPRS
jgi:hypothetical protein